MFWKLGAGYVWGFSRLAIVLRQSHILCNQFHLRHNHDFWHYTDSKTSMTRKWFFVVFGPRQIRNIPNHEPYLCADCGFQRQEHGDSYGPNHTDVLIAETLVLPDSGAHYSRGLKVILYRHHLLSNNSTGWVSQFNILTVLLIDGFQSKSHHLHCYNITG